MKLVSRKEENNFLFSRSENLKEEQLIAVPAGNDYDELFMALKKMKAQAVARHKEKMGLSIPESISHY